MDVPTELRRKMIIALIDALRESPSFKNIQLSQLKEAVLNSENQTYMQSKNRDEYVYYIHEKLKKIQSTAAQRFEFHSARGRKPGYEAAGMYGRPDGSAPAFAGPAGGQGAPIGMAPVPMGQPGPIPGPMGSHTPGMPFKDGEMYRNAASSPYSSQGYVNTPYDNPGRMDAGQYAYKNPAQLHTAPPANYGGYGHAQYPGTPVGPQGAYGGKPFSGAGDPAMGMEGAGSGGPVEQMPAQGGAFNGYMANQQGGAGAMQARAWQSKARTEAPLSNQFFERPPAPHQGPNAGFSGEYAVNRSYIGNIKNRGYEDCPPEAAGEDFRRPEHGRGFQEGAAEKPAGAGSEAPGHETGSYKGREATGKGEIFNNYDSDFFKSEKLFGDTTPVRRPAKAEPGVQADLFRNECSEKMPERDFARPAPAGKEGGFRLPFQHAPAPRSHSSSPQQFSEGGAANAQLKEKPSYTPLPQPDMKDLGCTQSSGAKKVSPSISFIPGELEAFLRTNKLQVLNLASMDEWAAQLAHAYKNIDACSKKTRQFIVMQWRFQGIPFLDSSFLSRAAHAVGRDLATSFDYSDYFERSVSAFESIKAINKDSVFQLSSEEND
ncbi:hypothetical protein PAPHI01_1261 [Pancytospora philotis]|nr:hypothetical protein PAPHI01_1261 [Pancytospora philotis]